MRTVVRDREAFEGLSPIDFRAYLAAQGWREDGRIGSKATIHVHEDEAGETWEILLPAREDLGDYLQRMAEAVHILSRIENRSEIEILNDLVLAGSDVLRVRAEDDDREGTISVQDGVALLENARNLILTAACAAIEPRPSYHTRKADKAMDYLRGVRLGQTERGSYVITLLSPVGPALKRSRQPALAPEFENDPFERLVTRVLAHALMALREAIIRAAATDDFQAFEEGVVRGISANLCEAVANLIHAGRGVEIGLTWARVRPAPTSHLRVNFSRDAARVLEEAAREFRSHEPLLDYTVNGWVTKLDRDPTEVQGRATLSVLVDGKPRQVSAIFEPHEYSTVVKAHDEKAAISCEGDLYRVGRIYELRNPRGLVLLPVDDEIAQKTPA